MRQLAIEGKILFSKTFASSKVEHLAQLEKIQKQFIWKNGNPKLKHSKED